jgi:AcrR family transcriptional regulator
VSGGSRYEVGTGCYPGKVSDIVVDVSTQTERRGRSDARRNREAIVDAARELFSHSSDFAMSEVARRAGVGQGTLYRNFADRGELAAAVMADKVDYFERLASEHKGDPEAFFVLLRTIVEHMIGSALVDFAADAAVGSELANARRRVGQYITQPLRDAKAAGRVRRDLTVDDVFLIARMVRGALDQIYDPGARAIAATRALTLALDGAAPQAIRAT